MLSFRRTPGAARALPVALALAVVGCGNFEDPQIVLDLRVLAMTASPPEIVVPFDPSQPLAVELGDSEICALVADPGPSRSLTYAMRACGPTDSGRCDEPDRPFVEMGEATVEDPDDAAPEPRLCMTLRDGPDLLLTVQDSIAEDDLLGFGGVAVRVELRVRPSDTAAGDPAEIFAFKRMWYAPLEPPERVANQNPTLSGLCFSSVDQDADPVTPHGCVEPATLPLLPLGRCAELSGTPDIQTVAPEQILEIFPVEPDGVREDYVLPTFDGGSRDITENLTYAWFSTAGSWSAGSTGGPRDIAGNPPSLESRWTAPIADEIGDGLDVSLWLVQRDERGGTTWFESCVHVAP